MLFKLRVSSLLSPLNNACLAIVDDDSSFQFSFEAQLTSFIQVHITFATNTEAEPFRFAQLLLR